jgi:hypothetical protein
MQTQFLIWVGGQENVNLRISCNDVLIDEIPIEQDDDIILSKAVEHEAGNYQYTFTMDYQNVDDKNNSNDALILWNILIDGKPYGHFVDSLMTPDLGWMKNNLWKNDKGLIFASQPQSLLLTLRGEHVLLDNQTPLKCVKGLDKIILDPMADPMATPDVSQIKRTGHVYKDYVLCALVIDRNLIIKEMSELNEDETNKIMSQRNITTKAEYLQFVDEAMMTYQIRQCLPEYYWPYIQKVQQATPGSTKTADVRAGKQDVPEQYK